MREAIDMPKLASLADARGRRRANGAAAGHAEETAGYDLGDDADDREEIDCTPGRRDRVVDHGMTIFASHPAVYARGGQLVRVVRADKLGQHDRLRTDAERLLIAPCLAEWIATELARRVVFRKWDRRARKSIACDPPSWLAPAMLADGEFEGVRHLQGITSAPVLRPDGSVHSTPGYDAMTGMLLAAKGTLPMIPHAPPKDVAAAALARLRVLLGGYVWGDDFSEAVALSLLPGDDEEMRKAISAALLAGESFVVFDNITNGKTLRSASLDKTLTASIVGDRLLGKMDRLTLVNGAVWAATGNNITPCADMVRRTIVARIDPRTERPWERRFDWTPAGYAREHRAELLAAALTILAAHLQANTAPLAPPLQSFDQWSRIVRDALLWLGMPDAVRSQDAIADEDPDAEDRAELLGALRAKYGTSNFTAEDAAQTVRNAFGASESSDVGRLASAINARLNGKPATGLRVGYILRGVKDQVSSGAALRGFIDGHSKVMRWRITDV